MVWTTEKCLIKQQTNSADLLEKARKRPWQRRIFKKSELFWKNLLPNDALYGKLIEL